MLVYKYTPRAQKTVLFFKRWYTFYYEFEKGCPKIALVWQYIFDSIFRFCGILSLDFWVFELVWVCYLFFYIKFNFWFLLYEKFFFMSRTKSGETVPWKNVRKCPYFSSFSWTQLKMHEKCPASSLFLTRSAWFDKKIHYVPKSNSTVLTLFGLVKVFTTENFKKWKNS